MLPCEYIWHVIQSAANRLSALPCYEIEKSGAFNSTGALLVCSENMICACRKDIFIIFTHIQNQARLSPCNYTNLMPHSPLLIPNSVHIFIPVLNEGAATCFILNKRRLYLFLIWGSLGVWWCRLCRDWGGGSCMGIFWPLKESPHCQLPTIIKQPCRVYHWLCLTSLIRQACATYIGQQSSTASIMVSDVEMTLRIKMRLTVRTNIKPDVGWIQRNMKCRLSLQSTS